MCARESGNLKVTHTGSCVNNHVSFSQPCPHVLLFSGCRLQPFRSLKHRTAGSTEAQHNTDVGQRVVVDFGYWPRSPPSLPPPSLCLSSQRLFPCLLTTFLRCASSAEVGPLFLGFPRITMSMINSHWLSSWLQYFSLKASVNDLVFCIFFFDTLVDDFVLLLLGSWDISAVCSIDAAQVFFVRGEARFYL